MASEAFRKVFLQVRKQLEVQSSLFCSSLLMGFDGFWMNHISVTRCFRPFCSWPRGLGPFRHSQARWSSAQMVSWLLTLIFTCWRPAEGCGWWEDGRFPWVRVPTKTHPKFGKKKLVLIGFSSKNKVFRRSFYLHRGGFPRSKPKFPCFSPSPREAFAAKVPHSAISVYQALPGCWRLVGGQTPSKILSPATALFFPSFGWKWRQKITSWLLLFCD